MGTHITHKDALEYVVSKRENSDIFWEGGLAHSPNITPLIYQTSKWHYGYECVNAAKILYSLCAVVSGLSAPATVSDGVT